MARTKLIKPLSIIPGGAVKTNDEGIVEGFGIVFGSYEQPDRSQMRDFFTPRSFINTKRSITIPLYYQHAGAQIGEATLLKSNDGWEATATIDLTSPEGVAAYKKVKSKPHGFSTGALSHLVERVPSPNNTNWLKKWPVGEISLTPTPAEPAAVVYSVKAIDLKDDMMSAAGWDWGMGDEMEAPDTDEMLSNLEQVAYILRLINGDATQLNAALDNISSSIAAVVQNHLENCMKDTNTQIAELRDELKTLFSSYLPGVLKETSTSTEQIPPAQPEPVQNTSTPVEEQVKTLQAQLDEAAARINQLTLSNESLTRMVNLADILNQVM